MKNNKIIIEEFSGSLEDPFNILTREDLSKLRPDGHASDEYNSCKSEYIHSFKLADPELTTTLCIDDEDQVVEVIPDNERIESELSYAEIMCHLLSDNNIIKIAQSKNRELFDLEIGSKIYQFFKAKGKDPSMVRAFYFSMDTFADPKTRVMFKKMFDKKMVALKNYN